MVNYNCIVVLGPTASGKTKLACELAAALHGEIISLDSRQVYKGLDIGTGKDLHAYEINGEKIKYHLIDCCDPEKQFFLHDFVAGLKTAFTSVIEKKKLPILCGGTGLYLDALRKDFSFTQIAEDAKLRKELEHLNKEELVFRLEQFPEEHTNHVDRHSKKRLVRGIEVATYLAANTVVKENPLELYHPYYIGLNPGKKELETRITNRLQQRMQQGLVEEAQLLHQKGMSYERMEELGLEYKFLSAFLQNKIPKEEFFSLLATAIHQYAKRQRTWFRKMEKEGVNIDWLDPRIDLSAKIESIKKLLGFTS